MIHCELVCNTIPLTIIEKNKTKSSSEQKTLAKQIPQPSSKISKKRPHTLTKVCFVLFGQLHKQLFHTAEWMSYIKKERKKEKKLRLAQSEKHDFIWKIKYTPLIALIIIPIPPCFLSKLPREEQVCVCVCVESHTTASPLFCSSDYGLSCCKRGRNLTNAGSLSRHFGIQVWAHFLCGSQI